MLARDIAQRCQEAGHRHQDTLQRFDNNRGELVGVLLDDLDCALGVIERRDEHLAAERLGNADRVRLRRRIAARVRRHRAPQAVVIHAMPAALELEHAVATGRRAGHAQGEEGGLGA